MVQGHLLQKPQETDPDVNSSRARTLPRSPSRARSRHSVSVRKGWLCSQSCRVGAALSSMAAQAPRSHADHHPGLRLPPCWVCSRRRGLGRSPHPWTSSWVSVILCPQTWIMRGVLAGRSQGAARAGWARLTAEAPQPPYDGPETASDLEGVSDLERSWTPKQEGRQTFGQSLGQGGRAQNSPQGSPSPAWPRGPDSLQQTTPHMSRWPRAPEEREGEGRAASTGAVRAARADPGPPGARARGWGGLATSTRAVTTSGS